PSAPTLTPHTAPPRHSQPGPPPMAWPGDARAARVSTGRRDLRYVSPPGASGESHGAESTRDLQNPRTTGPLLPGDADGAGLRDGRRRPRARIDHRLRRRRTGLTWPRRAQALSPGRALRAPLRRAAPEPGPRHPSGEAAGDHRRVLLRPLVSGRARLFSI